MQDTASLGSRSHLIFQFACWLGLLVGLTDMAGRLRSAEDPGLKWILLGRRGSTVDLYKGLKLPWCIFFVPAQSGNLLERPHRSFVQSNPARWYWCRYLDHFSLTYLIGISRHHAFLLRYWCFGSRRHCMWKRAGKGCCSSCWYVYTSP